MSSFITLLSDLFNAFTSFFKSRSNEQKQAALQRQAIIEQKTDKVEGSMEQAQADHPVSTDDILQRLKNHDA